MVASYVPMAETSKELGTWLWKLSLSENDEIGLTAGSKVRRISDHRTGVHTQRTLTKFIASAVHFMSETVKLKSLDVTYKVRDVSSINPRRDWEKYHMG